MEVINNKYYIGVEGEPEIQFVCKKDKDHEIYVVWEGYFDQIMRLVKPDRDGWSGLAYCYNMYSGWYEESSWVVEDLQAGLSQLESIDRQMLNTEAEEILEILCNLFKDAILNNYVISIIRE